MYFLQLFGLCGFWKQKFSENDRCISSFSSPAEACSDGLHFPRRPHVLNIFCSAVLRRRCNVYRWNLRLGCVGIWMFEDLRLVFKLSGWCFHFFNVFVFFPNRFGKAMEDPFHLRQDRYHGVMEERDLSAMEAKARETECGDGVAA